MESVLKALEKYGLLLKQDKKLPNVVEIITGETLSTSWWSHPKGRLIFAVLSALADSDDVLITKLLYSKGTLIHRPLWPAVLKIGVERASWQMRGLSAEAKKLLNQIDRGKQTVYATGAVAKDLQQRLLVTAHEIHTDSGRHEMALESWQSWAKAKDCRTTLSISEARAAVESAAKALGAPYKALPWARYGD